jgi:hypothetical protein
MDEDQATPEVIYKYRDWANTDHKKILTEFELFLASPSSFNDPFDCKIFPDLKKLSEEDRINYINKLSSGNKEALLKYLGEKHEAFQSLLENITIKKYNDHLGVLSLAQEWNNILMWSHYADKHKGFCIGFYEEALSQIEAFGSLGKVEYSLNDNFPAINPLDDDTSNFFKNVYHKAQNWKYEREYRLMKIFRSNPATINDRKLKFEPCIISEIILGVNMLEPHKQEIINICIDNNIKVYQAKPAPFKFKTNRKEIVE